MIDQEIRKRSFEKCVEYAERHIESLIAPILLVDVETVAHAYLPYLLDGDPEKPTIIRIPGCAPYVREGAPAGMGTPQEFWVRLLIGQAEEGNRAAERALELAHHLYRTVQLGAWRQADTARLEEIRQAAQLLDSWVAARLASPPRRRRRSKSWQARQLSLLIQCSYIRIRGSKKRGLSPELLLPVKREEDEKKSEPALTICDAVLVAWTSLRDKYPDLPRITYYTVENAWRATTGADGKYLPFPDLHAGTGIDPTQHAEAARRWLETRMGNKNTV